MFSLFQLPWGLATALVLALQASASPSVNVGMRAAFTSGPYLIELLETAASENASSYFPLLDRIANGHFSTATTEETLYETFLEVLKEDGHISRPEAVSTFNLALSLRSAAPRIEAHYQYYLTAVAPLLPDDVAETSCETWVQFLSSRYCNSDLTEAEGAPIIADYRLLPHDRSIGNGRHAILYADPTSTYFAEFHQSLRKAAADGELSYRLRYRPQVSGSSEHTEPLPVSGYGVELALKRTDYIVIDDREATVDASASKSSTKVSLDEGEEVADLKPLSTSELAPIGLKAASFILQSQKPLDTLVKLTQDFPKYSASIASYDVSADFVAEQETRRVPAGLNHIWMNGVQLIERQIQAFTLLDMIRTERKLIDAVRGLGFTGRQAVSLLGHNAVSAAKSDGADLRYDWTDTLEDGKVIIWLNDLENDPLYADFPKTLAPLMQRTYPGQLPPIGKNIFHVIMPVDLSDGDDAMAVGRFMSLLSRGIPIRFGIVPVTSSKMSIAHTKVAYHILDSYGRQAFQSYLGAIHDDDGGSTHSQVFADIIEESQILAEAEALTYDQILGSDAGDARVKLARHWVDRLSPDTSSQLVFANGLPIARDGNWLQTLMMSLGSDLQEVQRGIFQGLIGEEFWVPGLFLEEALSKRNAYITAEGNDALKVLDMSKVHAEHADLFGAIPIVNSHKDASKDTWATLTVIADLSVPASIEVLFSAVQFKRSNPGVRLDVIHNPEASARAAPLNAALKASQDKLAEVESLDNLMALLQTTHESDRSYDLALFKFVDMARIERGSTMLSLNGRVIGPIASDTPFGEEDFQQFLDFEQRMRLLPVYNAVENLGLSDRISCPLCAAKITSIVALSTISDLPDGIFESAPAVRSTMYDSWASTHTSLEVGDPDAASIHIIGLLNPVSEQGQRWAPILKVLSELDGVYLKLFMNPKDKIEELPVKRFYRYVLRSKPSFDESGNVKSLGASFHGLPSEALLTAAMDVPPAWLVAPKDSIHDLDNIKLSTVKSDVQATYELEHILIEGHSREGSGKPPRGAQLVLGTETNPHLTDTLIMANLGFFQFKANPGVYNIQLKQGRSNDIYGIDSIGAHGWQPISGDNGTQLALMDFQGTTLYPRLSRKAGMEEMDVLDTDDEDADGLVSKGLKFAGSLFGSSPKPPGTAISSEPHADINIFSVASGHLYERMLNIMMVSVMRNTKHTVKFWFIEQFLSPSFKEFIPHLAEAYGFQYEMVTYKWPHWLRQQKEKQREIWGYKILFLDVLFPLSLDKVIFVDADQIVRTDMIDLVNHDLQGAPYGFTPMGDSRTEMEGFRFWKQGYWANYLRGKSYHISALYVVDLRRFRELAAGDRLRQTYHTLSADPNSLSNLDQDLPNHMQMQIPIHSLPAEWLWCETWCADEDLATAKTIDLCNNPQTKEPKLDRARRQVPEWTVYDEEIAELDRRRRGGASGKAEKEEGHVIDEL